MKRIKYVQNISSQSFLEKQDTNIEETNQIREIFTIAGAALNWIEAITLVNVEYEEGLVEEEGQ